VRIVRFWRSTCDVDEHLCGFSEYNPATLPEISRFLGIVIYMYYREHQPAHFHANYAEYEITVDIASGVVTGKFPRRALKVVLSGMSFTGANWKKTGSVRVRSFR
jgi:hypothetical protein